jgi:surface antigen
MYQIGSLHRGAAVLAMLTSLLITGCATTDKETMGTVLGGALGGLIGHQVDDGGAGGIVVGALAGALVGKMIGRYMDQSDRERLAKTLNETPSGQAVEWKNENSGNDFRVIPTSDYHAQGDKECRTFDQVVVVDGREEMMKGVACRSPGSDELAIDERPI